MAPPEKASWSLPAHPVLCLGVLVELPLRSHRFLGSLGPSFRRFRISGRSPAGIGGRRAAFGQAQWSANENSMLIRLFRVSTN